MAEYKKRNETKVQKDLREALEAEVGGFWWKVHGGMFQIVGIQDICGCVQGLYIAIETKVSDNKLSEVQKTRHKQIREAGGYAITAKENIEVTVRRVKRYVENHALQSAKESRKIIRKKKADRVIYGAGDWENTNDFRTRRPKTSKTK